MDSQHHKLYKSRTTVTHYMLMKLCSHVDHDPNKRYLLPSRAYEEEITAGREQ